MRRLPFGKHCGERITDVPASYLRWLHRQPWLDDDLAADVSAELHRRAAGGDDRRPAAHLIVMPPAEIADTVAAIVKTGFRRLALDRHPDRGGDHGDMVQLNRAFGWLTDHVMGGAA